MSISCYVLVGSFANIPIRIQPQVDRLLPHTEMLLPDFSIWLTL